MALELSFIYIEGLVYSFVMFLVPLLNLYLTAYLLVIYSFIVLLLAGYGSVKEKRYDTLKYLPAYIFLKYVNAYVFLEQFVKEVVFRRRNLSWVKPERVNM